MASYSIQLKRSAVKELDSLPNRDRPRVVERIRTLATDPRPPGTEKLSGREHYRVRQGPYRILYEVDDVAQVVTIVRIGHRRDVYR